MTEDSKATFLAERARALAAVILTRRDDLSVTAASSGSDLDLHVAIDREDVSPRRSFGVALRAVPDRVTAADADQIVRSVAQRSCGPRRFAGPVGLLILTMQEDQAYFGWLAEPTVTTSGPKLVHHDSPRCVPMTNELLDEVVDAVVHWHEAVDAVLIAP